MEHPAYAQNHIRFASLTADDGLAQNHVEAFLQDRQGFMWIGTRGGLSRFDGYTFTNYTHDPDNPNSLSANHITDLAEDSEGIIWITTSGGGVNRFNPHIEIFTRFLHDPDDPNSVGGDILFSVFQDSLGNLWFGGIPESGLTKFETDTGKFTRYYPSHSSEMQKPEFLKKNAFQSDRLFPRAAIWRMVEDKTGNLWLAADFVLTCFDPRTEQFVHYPLHPDEQHLAAFFQDKDGILWVGGETGLYSFNPKTEQFTHYRADTKINISSIIQDSTGILWIGTRNSGLYRFEPKSGKFADHYIPEPANMHGLKHHNITELYHDKAGVIWIGTREKGLNRFDPRQYQFAVYNYSNTKGFNLSWAAMDGDKDGNLWGSTGHILNRLEPDKGITKQYPLPENRQISAVYCDSQENVWLGAGLLLYRFQIGTGTFAQYELPQRKPQRGPPVRILSICEDKSGKLWIAAEMAGLFQSDPQKVNFRIIMPPHPGEFGNSEKPLTVDAENPEFFYHIAAIEIRTLYRDRYGNIWIGYQHGPLSCLNPVTRTFQHYYFHGGNINGWVEAIYEDRNGTIWIASGSGLYRFEQKNQDFRLYTEKDGLPSSSVTGILEENAGSLWLSTKNGISRFDPRTKVFRNYDEDDGLQGNDFIRGSYWKAPDGRMYFGGTDGVTAFYPDQIQDNPYMSPVVLTRLRLFNEPVPVGKNSFLKHPVWDTAQLAFTHEQKIISFEFAVLHYAAPHKNKYCYILEGFEEKWNYVGAKHRFATYTGLPAGNYLFRVRGTNDSGVWSNKEASIEITILPPWWETPWFRGVMFLIIAGMAIAGYRWRVSSIERQNHLLEIQVRERTCKLAQTNLNLEQEIIERRQAEDALRKSEHQIRLITDNSPAYIAYINADDLRYRFVNRQFENFGISRKDIIGKHIRDVIGQTNYEFALKYIEIVRAGSPVSYENLFHLEQGRRWVNVNYVPDFDKKGRVRGIVVLSYDISEIKQIESELRQAKETAESANRAKSTFLANMSHELRTPLNAILGFAQIMNRSQNLQSEEKENLDIILHSGKHLLRLINQVLDLSKIEAQKITINENNFDLYSLLDDLNAMFSLKADAKGLRLVSERSPDIPRFVRTDEVRLRQILINLLNNALKFTHKGSIILRVLPVEHLSTEYDESPKARLRFEIKDTGPGIEEDELSNIFDAFFQSETGRQAQEGTGLGLTISRKFVQLMGGEMNVESTPGKGSAFNFEICVNLAEEKDIKKKPWRRIIALEQGQPGYRILIADDQPDNRQVIVSLLKPLGFGLREAENGKEALEIWRQWHPHIILMDMRMPVMNGYEAVRIIRNEESENNSKPLISASHSRIPVIAVTASSFDEDRETVLSAGCDAFMKKPFEETELFDILHEYIGVRYVYEAEAEIKNEKTDYGNVLTREAVSLLPDELRMNLRNAAERIDFDMTMEVILQIRQQDEPLADTLENIVKKYRFDILQSFFE